jgi:hypothetical protein
MLTVSYDEGNVFSFTVSGKECGLLLGALECLRMTELVNCFPNAAIHDVLHILYILDTPPLDNMMEGEPSEGVCSTHEEHPSVVF